MNAINVSFELWATVFPIISIHVSDWRSQIISIIATAEKSSVFPFLTNTSGEHYIFVLPRISA
jgi:hypothetical protein